LNDILSLSYLDGSLIEDIIVNNDEINKENVKNKFKNKEVKNSDNYNE
jgi:hypothetical protein